MDGRKLDVILYCKYISTATGFALGYSDYDYFFYDKGARKYRSKMIVRHFCKNRVHFSVFWAVCWEFGIEVSKTMLYNLGIFSLQDMSMGTVSKQRWFLCRKKVLNPRKCGKVKIFPLLRMFGKSFQQIIRVHFFDFCNGFEIDVNKNVGSFEYTKRTVYFLI